MNKEALLKTYWGFDSFKSLQGQIIDSVLANKDTLAFLPTGGGKSICYQIPALIKHGFALVISPLIALMEDQVNGLREIGIKSMYFQSDPKAISISQQLDNAINGNYKVVFVSPERLSSRLFLQQIKSAPISLIAVDEAHCISEWGHDFRPAYRKINYLMTLFPDIPKLALTASATPEVKKDIETLLDLKLASRFQNSLERPNISYNIWNTEDKYNSVIQLLDFYKGSSIIYCYSRKETQYLVNFINKHKHRASNFHGGLLRSEKKQRLKDWHEGKISHMVATSAFGMGIDKLNVRNIIHISLPDSIENYYQETGRAGRDGKPSQTYLLYHQGDLNKLEKRIFDQLPDEIELKGIYKDLCNYFQIAYGEGQQRDFSLNITEFCNRYKRTEKKLHQCLIQFEKTGIIKWYASKARQLQIKSKIYPERMLHFIKNDNTKARVIEHLIRHYPNFFTQSIRVSIQRICFALKVSSERLLLVLKQLQQENLIDYTGSTLTFYLSFQVPREDKYTLRPTIALLKNLRTQKIKKLDALVEFIKDDLNCKRNLIFKYFGEDFITNCEQCSSNSCKSDDYISPYFRFKIIELLKIKPHSIHELNQKLYFKPKALESFFSELLEKQIISKNSLYKYYYTYE